MKKNSPPTTKLRNQKKPLQKEETLTQNELKQLSRIVSQIADTVAITNIEGVIRYVNPAFEKVTGYSAAEAVGKTSRILKSGLHDQELYEELWRTVLSGNVFQKEMINRRKNGELYYETKTITPIRNEQGAITNFVATGKDITENKRANDALRESEERFRGMFESSSAIMMMIEPDSGNILEANPAAAKFYGYSIEQLVIMNIAEINQLPPEEVAAERQKAKREERAHFIFPHRLADGRVRTVEVHSQPIKSNDQALLFSIIYDITERKQTEEALNESKLLFHLLIESLPQNIYAKDLEGRFIFANQHYCQTQGKSLEEIVGKTDFELHPLELAEKYRMDDQRVIETGKAIELEEEHVPIEQNKFYVEVIKTPFSDSKGQTAGTLGIFWDITKRKQSEELLHQQSDQLRILYEASQRLNRTLDLKEIYQTICDFMSSIAPNDGLFVSDFDKETQQITCRAYWLDDQWLDVSAFPPLPLEEEGKGTQSRVIRSGQAMLINDFIAYLRTSLNVYYVNSETNEVEIEAPPDDEEITRSVLIAPLKSGDQVIGVIQVMSYRLNAYTENQLQLLEALAIHIVSAEKNALLYTQVQNELKERKQIEEALRQSNETSQAILNAATESVFLLDTEGIVLATNETTASRLGKRTSDLIGKCMYDFLPVDVAEHRRKQLETAVNECKPIKFEDFRLGAWIENNIYPILDPDGQVTRLAVYGTDITKRKQNEIELTQSRKQLEATLDALPDLMFELDDAHQILDFRAPNLNLLYTAPEEFIGKSIYDIMPEDATRVIDLALDEALRTGRHFGAVYSLLMPNGVNWFELSISRKDLPELLQSRFIVLIHDITDRKRAETLQETVYQIAEASQIAESLQDLYPQIHKQVANVMYAENFYIALHDEEKDLLNFVYTVDEKDVSFPVPIPVDKGTTSQVLRTGKSLLFKPTDETQTMEIIGAPSSVWLGVPLIVHGKTIGVMAIQHYSNEHAYTENEQRILEYVSSQVATAIDRKQKEEEVQLIEKRNSALIENAPDGIALIDIHGKFTFASPSAYSMFGYTAQEIVRHSALKFMHPDDEGRVRSEFQDLISHPSKIFTMEYRFRHKDGTYRWIEGTFKNLLTEPGLNAMVNNFRDITERKLAEELLRKNRSSLEMAQSVAHLGSWEIDIKTGTESWSKEMFELFHRDPKRGVPMKTEFLAMVHPQDRQLLLSNYQRALEFGERSKYEYRVNLPQNNLRYFETRLMPIKDTQGQVGISGTVLDITERRQSETALRLSEERFLQLTENIQEVFWLFDMTDQTMIYISPAYEIIWKRTCQSLYENPRNYLENILTEDRPIMIAALEQQAKGKRTEVEYRIRRPDGSIRWLWDRGFPIFDETGKLVRTAGVATDVTNLKNTESELQALNRDLEKRVEERTAEVRRSEATYRALFENSNDGIFLFSPSNMALQANQQGLTMIGYTLEEWIGNHKDNVIPNDQRQNSDLVLEAAIRGDHVPLYERTLISKDGKKVEVEINLSAIRDADGKAILVQSVVRDISERKKAQEALRESRDQLSVANAALEKALRLKDEFLASMSHELRTPLTGVLGLSEAMQLQTFGALNEKQIKVLKNIEDSGRHLLELINDILDLSKIGAGKLDLQIELCSVTDICQASLQLVKGMAQQKKQTINFRMDPASITLRVDVRRMKQILVNLLSNAVKFTPEGGSLGLEVQANPEKRSVLFSVWDKGVGIHPEQIGQLFKPFTQLDSSLARQYSGTGLGLSLVLRMTELHGGSVEVESTPSEGSRFTIILPWPLGTTQPLPELKEYNFGSLKSALVIEDDILDVEHLKRYLTEKNIISVAHPGMEGAVEKAAAMQPSFILLDLRLPDGFGLDLLAELKGDKRTQAIPVIITSVEERRSEAMQLGASGYLVKPFTLQDLTAELSYVAPFINITDSRIVNGPRIPSPLVLIADDSELVIEMISDFLEANNYRVVATRNGIELLERAPELRPDIMLVDIQMPGLNGMETIRRIRSHIDKQFAATPVIAVTALAMFGDRERSLQAGANEYLSKPVKLQELAAIIKQQIEKKHE